jgi:hypothetical protein|tara:strand:+ start:1116 stop:1493 length:378 start_codon:yes stop_codon:yes gene_type:complete
MANNAESKNGYVNFNLCRSFNQHIKTSMTILTGAAIPGEAAATSTTGLALTGGHPCSEITIWNRTTNTLTVYDNDYSDALNGFILSAGEQFTFRGLTNVAQVSATATTAGKIYYRAQYYSFNPSR